MQSAYGLEMRFSFKAFLLSVYACSVCSDSELRAESLSVRYEEKVRLFNISTEPH